MHNILSKDKIKYLIVHCSDTNDDFTIEEIQNAFRFWMGRNRLS